MTQTTKKKPIREWSVQDRPREKLITNGKNSLSNSELIAILLGSGTRELSAIELAKHLLDQSGNSLAALSLLSVQELQKHKGIGEAKAVAILTALELGRRRQEEELGVKEKVTASKDAFYQLKRVLSDLSYECFWILLLNRSNCIIKRLQISEGGQAGTVADPKKIFKLALDHHAASIILGHNHPSGQIQPSEADLALTRKIQDGARLLDLAVLDHLIIGENEYYSMADEGKM